MDEKKYTAFPETFFPARYQERIQEVIEEIQKTMTAQEIEECAQSSQFYIGPYQAEIEYHPQNYPNTTVRLSIGHTDIRRVERVLSKLDAMRG